MSEQIPYTKEQADALMLEAGTESPRYNFAIKGFVRDFGKKVVDDYGTFMSDEARRNLLTAHERTIPVSDKEYKHTVYRFVATNADGVRGWLMKKFIELADYLNLDTLSDKSDSKGIQTHDGRISFLHTESIDKIIAALPEDIKSKKGKMSDDDFRKLIFVYYVLVPALHEALHQAQDLTLTKRLSESSVNYYVSSYLGIGLEEAHFQSLVNQFGDDAHRLVFNNLVNQQRRREILSSSRKLI